MERTRGRRGQGCPQAQGTARTPQHPARPLGAALGLGHPHGLGSGPQSLGLEHPHGLGFIPWGKVWVWSIPMVWAPSLGDCFGVGESPWAGLHPSRAVLGLGHPHRLGSIPWGLFWGWGIPMGWASSLGGCSGVGASPWPGLHPLGTGLGYSHGLGSIPWGLIWGWAPSLAVLSPPRNPSVPESFWLKLGGNSSEKIGFTKIQQTPPSGGGTGDFNKTQDWLFCWV